MKKIINITILLFLIATFSLSSCKKNYGNLNSPTVDDFLSDATKDQLNNLVSGTESAMRNNLFVPGRYRRHWQGNVPLFRS